MRQLSPIGQRVINELSQRHGFSPDERLLGKDYRPEQGIANGWNGSPSAISGTERVMPISTGSDERGNQRWACELSQIAALHEQLSFPKTLRAPYPTADWHRRPYG